MPLALEDAHVRPAEGRVAERVAHRVDGAVDVAQVVEEVPERGRDAVRARRQRLEQHQDVVRRPRDDERQQDGAQRLGRLLLGFLLLRLFLLLHGLSLARTKVGQQRPRPIKKKYI